jgi:HTH-type transcriptional regulator/antitoxin HipB
LSFLTQVAAKLSYTKTSSYPNTAPTPSDNPPMAQGKRISADIDDDALQTIKDMGAAAKLARVQAGEGQAAAAARLGVHVQTIGRIESGEPGVAIGHVMGLLALYGISARLLQPGDDRAP